MIKTLTIAAALAAFASTASAAEIHVSLVGKDQKTIQADIARAARSVCREELATRAEWIASYARCVDESVARAMSVLADRAS